MKQLLLTLGAGIIFLVSSYALPFYLDGSIVGKIAPADGAKKVSAMNEKDSMSVDIINGNFSIPVKEGVYKVEVEANPPYQNVTIEIVNVSEGKPTDIGEIKLEKK